ncbi:MobC family plasmid mobilization relaxosome protein [Marinilactibacillus psychrotolerans]|uniref:MobC family plasmid mobilization relaxosome protein n=1 Tax=Marinilactibacillus psychrotolerans TaxID=191770 RepID=A0A5R9BYW2_9LACT|nr:MobC family plasmid mobilization relaxosome protein [Marinilactibacillus psychrotolerans]TLQ05032.1 MobC family plasmid mobilization relaxosome protein [Marinilactibacillus psychrotolerans]GEQ34171.1 mobilization protein [Marinilactibacillus psychrotolerans]
MSEREIFEAPFAEAKPKRKEPKQISFRVSESEFEKLKRSAEIFQMSVPAFVKSKAQEAKLVTPKIDRPGAVEIAKQLRAIGNNVNQMARATNATELDSNLAVNLTAELQKMQKELNQIWQQLN